MIEPKKPLGQHFLIDKNIIQKIIKRARLKLSDIVVEIGAGRGELTFPLAQKVTHVFAIEKDKELFYLLKDCIRERRINNITLVKEDALKWDFSEACPQKKLVVVGNIPYSISSPLINRLIKDKAFIERAIIMLQMEFAKRLIAAPNTKEYGSITVLLRYHATVKKLFEVSRNVFLPKPDVDSMVVEIVFNKKCHGIDENIFSLLVHGAFAHRRKNILNSLSKYFEHRGIKKQDLKEMLKKCNIDPHKRAESLDVEDFLCLASFLDQSSLIP